VLHDSEEDWGGVIRSNKRGHGDRSGRKASQRYTPIDFGKKTPDVAPIHQARDLILRAGLNDSSEGELIAMVSAAGSTELRRLLDSGELQERIEQALN